MLLIVEPALYRLLEEELVSEVITSKVLGVGKAWPTVTVITPLELPGHKKNDRGSPTPPSSVT